MKIIAFIEQAEIIEKILRYVGFWNVKKRPPPKANSLHDFPKTNSVASQMQLLGHLPTQAASCNHLLFDIQGELSYTYPISIIKKRVLQ